jgi:large subunit ribosomal protein L10
MLTRTQKEAIIADLKKDIGAAKAIFLTNLIGVSSNSAVAIRKNVRDANGKVVVTRNTLFAKATQGTDAEKLFADLKGPHAVAFAFDDAAAVAKCIKNAGAEFELVQFKGGFFDGKILAPAELKVLADLPSRNEMLGTLLATFNAPVSAFARVINAIKDKVESEGSVTVQA